MRCNFLCWVVLAGVTAPVLCQVSPPTPPVDKWQAKDQSPFDVQNTDGFDPSLQQQDWKLYKQYLSDAHADEKALAATTAEKVETQNRISALEYYLVALDSFAVYRDGEFARFEKPELIKVSIDFKKCNRDLDNDEKFLKDVNVLVDDWQKLVSADTFLKTTGYAL